jgi:aldose 1-epimerase
LEVDDRLIPTGRRLPVDGTPYDFLHRRTIGATAFDVCFADFLEPWLEFDGIRLGWDGNHSFLQVFSGDGLPPERRRRGLATEPMSCAADAFNSGEDLAVLQPGDYESGTWTLRTLT